VLSALARPSAGLQPLLFQSLAGDPLLLFELIEKLDRTEFGDSSGGPLVGLYLRNFRNSVSEGDEFGQFGESTIVNEGNMVDDFVDDEVEDGEIAEEEVVGAALLLILEQTWLNPVFVELVDTLFFLLAGAGGPVAGDETDDGVFEVDLIFEFVQTDAVLLSFPQKLVVV